MFAIKDFCDTQILRYFRLRKYSKQYVTAKISELTVLREMSSMFETSSEFAVILWRRNQGTELCALRLWNGKMRLP